MKIRTLITISLFLISTIVFGQKIKQPKNIEEAIAILDVDCPDSLKEKIKKTNQDSLLELIWPWSGEYRTISEWDTDLNSNEKTELEKFYLNLGIDYPIHIETIILISFQAHLNNDSITHDQIIKPFQLIEQKWKHEDSIRFTTDSLRGVYIPKDLDDCFKQIDSFWSDSTKNIVRNMTEKQFCSRSHFGIGLWMRNNWQLWGGSRLSKYFNDLGIYHPDDMSGIVLTSYYRYLTGKEIKLDKQIKFYQNYWKKNN